MTLGCGGYGGNITSDNISPRHLLNIKRLAYEITPVANRFESPGQAVASGRAQVGAAAERRPEPTVGVSADALNRKVDEFLASRGYTPPAVSWGPASAPTRGSGFSRTWIIRRDNPPEGGSRTDGGSPTRPRWISCAKTMCARLCKPAAS